MHLCQQPSPLSNSPNENAASRWPLQRLLVWHRMASMIPVVVYCWQRTAYIMRAKAAMMPSLRTHGAGHAGRAFSRVPHLVSSSSSNAWAHLNPGCCLQCYPRDCGARCTFFSLSASSGRVRRCYGVAVTVAAAVVVAVEVAAAVVVVVVMEQQRRRPRRA